MNKCTYYKEKLNLKSHVEGGSYNEVYVSNDIRDNKKTLSTIYFLLERGQYSAFHKLESDESWFFHDGDPLIIYAFNLNMDLEIYRLGKNLEEGETFQVTIPKGYIFASTTSKDYSLVSCAVAPAFTYDEFKLYTEEELLKLTDNAKQLISDFSYKKK